MSMDPCMTQNDAFWRTAGELRHLMAELHSALGQDPKLRSCLAEVEAIQASLERKVRYDQSPLQRVVGWP